MQLTTLIWFKWILFRNSLRKSKAVINRLASGLTLLAGLALSMVIATGLGFAAYALSVPGGSFDSRAFARPHRAVEVLPSAEFVFFSILSLFYLLWATLPLSIGGGRDFDPGKLLLYPISLKKLFAIDLLSELVTLQSLFAIPSIIAIGLGAGLATGQTTAALTLALVAAAFGMALSKWVSMSVGALIRRKRTRGETLLALVGAIAGLGGALFGQLAPVIFRHADSIAALRWTPPGAVAYALTTGLHPGHAAEYFLALLLLSAYTSLFIIITYWLARRIIVGSGKAKRKQQPARPERSYTGWALPFISPPLAAIIEKELRYMLRNAQLRMMTLMPLILIVIRFMNRRRFDAAGVSPGNAGISADFLDYGGGLMATTGILYVFLILAGLFCNQFAFDRAGMRTLILSPVDRKQVILGKNISVSLLALVFCLGLLVINEIVFGDLSAGALLFATLSFIAFATLMSLMGNWFSLHFPKRVKYGKRLNVSGVVALLLIPMIVLLAMIPLAATASGYVARSVPVEYVTLAFLTLLSLGFYLLLLPFQGEALAKRELEIHDAVNEPGE